MKRRQNIPRSPQAFTFVDLLVSIALIVFLGTFVLFAADHTRGGPVYRLKCESNLRQIGIALQLYANDFGGDFPRTLYKPEDPTIRAYTGVAARNPFAADGPQANDVTAAMYLLLRTEDCTSAIVICPSTARVPWNYGGTVNTTLDASNFPSEQYLSYSLANPYPSAAAAQDGYQWTNHFRADFALAADMNPGIPAIISVNLQTTSAAMQAANSLNHRGVGQNILFGDSHVSFEQNPFQGVQRDNIYGPGRVLSSGAVDPLARGNLNSSPGHKDDSVLLPLATSDPGSNPFPSKFQVFVSSGELGGLGGWAFLGFALVAAVRWGPSTYRRMRSMTTTLEQRRLRLGLCLKCGYDLRASPEICPECGEPRHFSPSAGAGDDEHFADGER